MFCSSCGSQLGGGAFCASCGAPTSSTQSSRLPAAAAAADASSPQTQFAYSPAPAYRQPNSFFQNETFELLSRLAAFALGASFLLWVLRFLLITDDFWDWSDKIDLVFGENTLHSFILVVFAGASIAVGVLQAKVWVRWAVVTGLNALYWLLINPMVEAIINTGEFTPTSPLEVLVTNLESLDFFFNQVGFFFTISWLLALLLAQLAPLVATFAMLAATIKNKRLS
jgi:hypothetical protein